VTPACTYSTGPQAGGTNKKLEQFLEIGSTLEVKVLYFSFYNMACRFLKQKEFFNKPTIKALF
jgi:hypothetical protein